MEERNQNTINLYSNKCLHYEIKSYVDGEKFLCLKMADFEKNTISTVKLSKDEIEELMPILEEVLTSPDVTETA